MPVVLGVAAVALVALMIVAIRFWAQAREAEQSLRLYRVAFEHAPDSGVLILDRSLRVEFAAGPGLLAFGLEQATLTGCRLRTALNPEVGIVLSPALDAAIEGRGARLQIPTAGRDYVLRVAPIRGGDDRVAGVIVSFHDVTHPSLRERRLNELASRDGLTGLWNRRALEHELDQLLSSQNAGGGVVLLVDLDEFKRVNDSLGHEAGDQLLCQVARALESRVRRTDVVARLGGDEFALLLPHMTEGEANRVAEQVAHTVRSVWPPGLPGGASVGLAAAGGRHLTTTAVLAAADRAMYASKRARCLAQAS